MMWGYDGLAFGGGGMGIGMLLFWALIIGVFVVLLRGFGAGTRANEPRVRAKTPLEIPGERYAKGEIDKTEFDQKRSGIAAG